MAEDWITTAEAVEISGYHVEHIRRLIRRGAIVGRKWGTQWQVCQSSLLAYLRKVEKLGKRRGPKTAAEKSD